MIVITLGTFDLFHRGHLRLLKRCKELAGSEGWVIVGLNSDEFVKQYKGKPPVQTYQERKEILEELPYVTSVVKNNQTDGTIKPLLSKGTAIVIGSDWGKKDYLKQVGLTWEWMEENDISLIYVPYTYGISTTIIKERLCTR
jgi:glycerol-3-phosphate cytidylyltransferase